MTRILLLIVAGFISIGTGFSQATHVVISEVYGGGGNSGATYKNDFIELYNPTNSAVDLTGWSVQYASATGTTWAKTNLSGIIQAQGYFLIQGAAGTGGTTNLPTPDVIGTLALSGTAGKVALVSNQTALSGAAPISSAYIDLVGFGTTANGYEGTGPTPAPSNTTSVERKANSSSTTATMSAGGSDEYSANGYDSDNNNSDFVTRAPEPQNSSSAKEPDTTPPTFASTFPKSNNISSNGFDLVINQNEKGKAYYVVLPDGATAPTSAQVKAGTDATDVAASVSGNFSITTANADVTKNITGLSQATAYDVYVVSEDLVPNVQTSPVLLEVTTNISPTLGTSSGSITFPGFTAKSKQSATQSYTVSASNLTADVSVTVSGNFLISTDNNTFSTSLSISSASFSADQTVYVKFNPANTIGTLTGTITHSSSGASDKTVSLSAIAIDPYNQNFNDANFLTNSGWLQYSVIGAQMWSSTNFGRTCLTGCTNATVDKAAQINGFSGSAQNNEDWLISPQLDLTSFNNFPALSFATISAFAGDVLQLKYSTDYAGSGDPSLATWSALDGKFPAANSSAWTTSSNIILPKSSLYVAFIYTSNNTAASRWTVDDWKVEDVAAYLDVPAINFAFGEIAQGNTSTAQSFTFDAQGYGDITISVPSGFEVSLDNSTFSSNVLVTEAEATSGKTVYVRFAPPTKQLKWSGVLTFAGTSLNTTSGSLKGSSYPKSETLDIVTYNLEFFGTDVKDASNVEFGPTDDALQITNVTTIMQQLGADIFAVEEVADDAAFTQLTSNLTGYNSVLSDRWSYSFNTPDPNFPPQKIGFLYNTSTVQLINTRVMFEDYYDLLRAGTETLPNYPTTSSSFWSSGRLPFMATFDVTINGITRRVRVVDIHSKSGSATEDYNRRKYDIQVLYDSLNANYPHDNIVLLGDFNDDVDTSIKASSESTYKVFVDDAVRYKTLTYDLSVAGGYSFPSSSSFLDHIIVSDELGNAYVNNSIEIEDPRIYVSNYSSTTSDHLPVGARFLLSSKADQTITFNALSSKTFGDANFDLTATASSGLNVTYTSSDPTIASISGATVSIHKAGSISITASQSGTVDFNAATDVIQSLVIAKAAQTITFNALASKTYGDGTFNLTGASSSGLPVTYVSSDPSIVSISGNVVTIHNAGQVNITASQAGNSDYLVATDVSQSLTIQKASQSISFSALATKAFGDGDFTLSASSTSGLTVSFESSDVTIASISGNTVSIHKAGTVDITATQAGNSNYLAANSVIQTLTVQKQNQTISFSALAGKTYGDAAFNVTATTTSGLAVVFESDDTSIATVSGNTITILKAGTVNIIAKQSGNANYNAASDVAQALTISKLTQTITFTALPTKTFGDANFDLSATSSSGLPVTYTSSDPSIASINGARVTLLKAGSITITAAQAGNENYSGASDVVQTLTVSKASQTISFGTLVAKVFGDADFSLNGSASSGLGVSYTSSDPTVASISGNTVTILKAGATDITASQSGNGNYLAASSITQSLTVNKANQAITFNALPTKTISDPDFTLGATSSSGLTVSYSSADPAIASISGSTVTLHQAGTVNITASQVGNNNYNAATSVVQSLTINKLVQTISFAALPSKTLGDADFVLAATATSGLSVAFSSSDPTIASISGTTVTIHKAGVVTITASQSGNSTYDAAANVSQVLTISKISQTIAFGALSTKTFGDAYFLLSATATSGLPVSFSSADASVASISGNVVTILKAGTVSITASQAGNANYQAATDVIQSLVINKANQTITFGSLANKTLGDAPFSLTASSTSGLLVSFSSSDPSTASINGSVVTLLKAGTVTITASQAGDVNYNSGASITQTLSINKGNQTITFDALTNKTLGDAPFTISATASSGLTVNFSTTSDKIAIAGNVVTLVKPGRASIVAAQSGNTNYLAATSVERSFCINPPRPTITLSLLNPAAPVLTSSASAGNQWYLNGVAINGATNTTHTVSAGGTYTVQAKADDCISLVSLGTPILVTANLPRLHESISFYPNPAEDYLFISGLKGNESIVALDMTGRALELNLEKEIEAHKLTIKGFASGVYLLRITSAEEVTFIKFMVK